MKTPASELDNTKFFNLSRHLGDTLGRGFSVANFKNFRQFYMIFPECATHCVANLTWTQLLSCDNSTFLGDLV